MAKPPKDIRARARVHADRAIEKLVDLVAGDEVAASTQLSAAKLLLELAYGRPAPRDGTPDDEKPDAEWRDTPEVRKHKVNPMRRFKGTPDLMQIRRMRKHWDRTVAQRRAERAAEAAEGRSADQALNQQREHGAVP